MSLSGFTNYWLALCVSLLWWLLSMMFAPFGNHHYHQHHQEHYAPPKSPPPPLYSVHWSIYSPGYTTLVWVTVCALAWVSKVTNICPTHTPSTTDTGRQTNRHSHTPWSCIPLVNAARWDKIQPLVLLSNNSCALMWLCFARTNSIWQSSYLHLYNIR